MTRYFLPVAIGLLILAFWVSPDAQEIAAGVAIFLFGMLKLAEKVTEYNERLAGGKASKIKPDHVQKTLAKLARKAESLEAEIEAAQSPEKKARLRKKLEVAHTRIEHAEWLSKELG